MITFDEKRKSNQLDDFLELAAKRIKRLARIGELADHPGWAALKEELELSVEVEDSQSRIDAEAIVGVNFDPAAFALAIKQRAAKALAFKAVIANVEHSHDKIAALNQDIATAKQRLHSLSGEDADNKPRTATPPRRTIA